MPCVRLFSIPTIARSKITADVAKRIDQAHDRAGRRARHRLPWEWQKNGASPANGPRNGQTQECVREPEGMFLEQNARDEGCARSRINEGGMTAAFAGQVECREGAP